MDELTVKDKISRVIDSEEFNLACRIEDEFAYDETEELLNVIGELKPVEGKYADEYSKEDIRRLLENEHKEFEERKASVSVQEDIRKKYYSRKPKKQETKALEDEFVH